MAVSTVGYNSNTAKRFLLDAGAVYKSVTFDELTGDFTGTLLGATSGGNEFVLNQSLREIEVDGVKGRAKGLTVIEREDAELLINLKELTAQNIALALAGGNVDTADTNYDIITSKGKIEDADYLPSIAFVGRQSGTNKPVVILMENVLSIEGLTVKTEQNNETIVPIRLAAHADADDIATGKIPVKIYWPKEVVA
jgi:hypothetical protein